MLETLECLSPQAEFATRSLKCLRKIRGSAFEWIARPKPVIPITAAVADAEEIGLISSTYIVDPIMGTVDDKTQKTLEGRLAELEAKYRGYRAYAYSIMSRVKFHEMMPTYLHLYKLLAQHPNTNESGLWEALIGSNNMQFMPKMDIFNNRVGIVSPLSSDYLRSVLLQRLIQVHTPFESFRLKPVILGPELDLDPNAGEEQEDPEFGKGVDRIVIWTNLDVSFRTRNGTLRAVEWLYPGKLEIVPANTARG